MKKTTSTAKATSGLQSSKKVSVSANDTNTLRDVPVATFRREIDRVLRMVNSDFHACVGTLELDNWTQNMHAALLTIQLVVCKRAKPADLDEYAKAIEQAHEYLTRAANRIENDAN